ncbi:hypothetical protein [Streptomyces sp. NBC_01451]|uniref:hypothetical protein n=1 Tax=Streptomyces sp. NBC_01451 TaxID=2903872 RepID=UPI002E31C0B6|nr:hypothetical protein [Streptomyces sp. NBC_01451]
MSSGEFEYLPYVTTQPGDTDELVEEFWEAFREFNEGFAALRAVYTGHTPKPGRHDRCTQPPLTFARIEHRDHDGRLTHSTSHRNLLSPTWWGDGRNAYAGPAFTRPGFFPNETGDAA